MGTLHSTILLSLLLIKVGPKVTLKGQYRPSVINDNLIQGHSSVFVTWSSLNKSYARNYTLPLDHISLRKQEELFLSLYLIFSELVITTEVSFYVFSLYLSCISTAEDDTCNGHMFLSLSRPLSLSPFSSTSLLVSNFKLPPHLSFSTLLPPTQCHIIYLFVSPSQLLSHLLPSLSSFPCFSLLVILPYLATTSW